MRKGWWVFGVLLVVLLSGCGQSRFGDYGYDDFPWVEDWEALGTLGFEEGYTLVYHYNRDSLGNDCPGCVLINERLFAFGQHNTFNITLHLVNERTALGQRPLLLRQQPSVFFMVEGEIGYRVVGAGPIVEFLDSLESGRFDWSLLP